MTILQIIILAIIQGAAELLPVSSSAHVIIAQKLMGLDPSSPEMTFFLVMLHTGTMFAVLLYFWPRWKNLGVFSKNTRMSWIKKLFIATAITGIVGYGLKFLIEHFVLAGETKGEIEALFKNLPMIATALFSAGALILFSSRKDSSNGDLTEKSALWIGAVQGICIPFRGFSRSGATISTGLIQGVKKSTAEDFSFALAIILTPPAILHMLSRLMKSKAEAQVFDLSHLTPGLLGMVFSFVAGYFALKLLSNWIEGGKWKYFGFYCWFAAVIVLGVHFTSSN